MTKTIAGVEHRLTLLGCYVDDLFTLYSHDGDGSICTHFLKALTHRWNVEDEGPVSDLLNVDITADADSVKLNQENVPPALHKTCAFASETFPKLVEAALLSKLERSIHRILLADYQPLVWRCWIARSRRAPTSRMPLICFVER
eukprot:6176306-Pleurochrysis_carterae.AAC.3